MNEEVDQWISKAEGDFGVASREIKVAADNSFDAVCFHAQQCIEKLMKAVLVQYGCTPPRTHGLIELDELIRSLNPGWAC